LKTVRVIAAAAALAATPALLAALLPGSAAATPAAGARPAASIFYYPWYGTPALDGDYDHWQTAAQTAPEEIASNYYPASGLYSSSDPAVVTRQMREIARAGIVEIAVSWWGWGSPEDRRLPLVLREARAQGLAVAIHLEPYEGRTAQSIAADLAHLVELGVTRVYVYHPFDIPEDEWLAIRAQLDPRVTLIAETTLVGRARAAGFSGVYTYDVLTYDGDSFARLCSQAHAAGLRCYPSVGPGYDASKATGDTRVRARRGGATYDAMWKAAIASRPDGVTITSFNEWHEGTQIEPALTPRSRLAARSGYESYDGAFGLHGAASQQAYLQRTAYWTARLRRAVP
jgi:hypothetical protein